MIVQEMIHDYFRGELENWKLIVLMNFLSENPEWFDYFFILLLTYTIENERMTNEERAKKYYQRLLTAIDNKNYKFLEESEPPDEIDWTQLTQPILDDFEELYGRIGEILEIRKSGSL